MIIYRRILQTNDIKKRLRNSLLIYGIISIGWGLIDLTYSSYVLISGTQVPGTYCGLYSGTGGARQKGFMLFINPRSNGARYCYELYTIPAYRTTFIAEFSSRDTTLSERTIVYLPNNPAVSRIYDWDRLLYDLAYRYILPPVFISLILTAIITIILRDTNKLNR